MHKPESILKNEAYRILWDFEILTDHLIQSRRSKEKKWICLLLDFAVPEHQVKNKRKQNDKEILRFSQRIKKHKQNKTTKT